MQFFLYFFFIRLLHRVTCRVIFSITRNLDDKIQIHIKIDIRLDSLSFACREMRIRTLRRHGDIRDTTKSNGVLIENLMISLILINQLIIFITRRLVSPHERCHSIKRTGRISEEDTLKQLERRSRKNKTGRGEKEQEEEDEDEESRDNRPVWR